MFSSIYDHSFYFLKLCDIFIAKHKDGGLIRHLFGLDRIQTPDQQLKEELNFWWPLGRSTMVREKHVNL